MSSERVPKQAFLWSCSLSDSGKVTRASHASDLLDRLDLHIFSPDGLQSNKFYDCLWDALANKFLQNWFQTINNVEDFAAIAPWKARLSLTVHRVQSPVKPTNGY